VSDELLSTFIEIALNLFSIVLSSQSTQYVSQTNQETMKLSLPSVAITALI
jgi:hypothetical protein